MHRAAYYKFDECSSYPAGPPFDPPVIYPELRRMSALSTHTSASNSIYAATRDLLARLGLDRDHIGSDEWNPFGDFVSPGQHVVIKPNLVLHEHPQRRGAVVAIVTHPAVVRPLVDYAYRAVGDSGRITIGDTPLENCVFSELVETTGLKAMVAQLAARGIANLELIDFRSFATTIYPDGSLTKQPLPGDPRGYTSINLGRSSLLQALEDERGPQNYYTLGDHSVDPYDPVGIRRGLPNKHHFDGTHVYRIPNTILDSDLVISVAKLKTHKFAGVTLSLKNMVGITEGKEYLPHRRPGTPQQGGDSFPTQPSASYLAKMRRKRSLLSIIGGRRSQVLRSTIRKLIPARLPHEMYSEPLWGDWDGNDTIWRSTLDLNLILFHANRLGVDLQATARKYLAVIDGVVGMDHEAPMTGLPVDSRLLVMARDPVAADTLGTYLMGFDPRKIPTVMGAAAPQCTALGKIALAQSEITGNVTLQQARCSFAPTKGWAERLCNAPEEWPDQW